MLVRHLSLTDFRNYTTADVALEPGANLFVGSNGQGKTNLVESLGYLSTLGSHRVSSDQALIRASTDSAVIRARLENEGRELLVEVQINRSGGESRPGQSRSHQATRAPEVHLDGVCSRPKTWR